MIVSVTHPSLEPQHLALGECIGFGNHWHDVDFVVHGAHERHVERLQPAANARMRAMTSYVNVNSIMMHHTYYYCVIEMKHEQLQVSASTLTVLSVHTRGRRG